MGTSPSPVTEATSLLVASLGGALTAPAEPHRAVAATPLGRSSGVGRVALRDADAATAGERLAAAVACMETVA